MDFDHTDIDSLSPCAFILKWCNKYITGLFLPKNRIFSIPNFFVFGWIQIKNKMPFLASAKWITEYQPLQNEYSIHHKNISILVNFVLNRLLPSHL